MKKITYILSALALSFVAYMYACQDDVVNPSSEAQTEAMVSKKPRPTTTTTTSSSLDTLYQRCGMVISDTGCWYPTVNISNINSYLRNLPSSDSTYYSQLVIRFDAPTITGKTISSYILFADQCSGRPACTKMNGIYMSQVTAGVPYNSFYISIGTSWLNPYVPSYTGAICVVTTDGCMFLSQPFTFTPPQVIL